MKNPERQKIIDQAAKSLRDAGFACMSILATDIDGEQYTALYFDMKKHTVKRGLGKSFSDIHKSTVPAKKLLGR